jgi:hypothetical protein
MRNIFKHLFTANAAIAAATIALVGSEIFKYDYETKRGSIEAIWKLNEHLDAIRPARSCFTFLGEWDGLNKSSLKNILTGRKPIQLRVTGSNSDWLLEHFRRCSGLKNDVNLDAATTEAGLKIEPALLVELRSQVLKVINAFDFSLAPYRNLDINNSVICENMLGYFYSHENRSEKTNELGKTRMLRVLEIMQDPDIDAVNNDDYANLPRFLKDIEAGKCPEPASLPMRFANKIYDSTIAYLKRALKS